MLIETKKIKNIGYCQRWEIHNIWKYPPKRVLNIFEKESHKFVFKLKGNTFKQSVLRYYFYYTDYSHSVSLIQ